MGQAEGISILTAFIAGVSSFLSPCILPLIPGYLSLISGLSLERIRDGSGERRWRLVIPMIFFVIGFTAIFVALGASATFFGKFLLSKISILSKIAGIAVIILGLNIMGVLRIGMLYKEKRFQPKAISKGAVSSLLIGMAFAFGWTPCVGPILAAILAYAGTKEKVLEGVLMLSAYSLGLGIPFLAIGVATDTAMSAINRIKGYIRAIEITSGILLVAIGVLIFTGDLSRLAGYLGSLFLPS
jgi:cytochrome c-type biogenesis protein